MKKQTLGFTRWYLENSFRFSINFEPPDSCQDF